MKLKLLTVASSVFLTFASLSQSIARQSIGAYGGSAAIQNVLIEQSVGQGQTIDAGTANGANYRPGFIQSRTFRVEEVEESGLLSGVVFPNPANNVFSVELDEWVENGEINITTTNGRVIYNRSIEENMTWNVNAQNWQNGVYFITLTTNEGQIFKRKLIISN